MGEPHSHDHDHAHEHEDGEPSSTGFLPLSLAVSLFVTGLFVLGYVQCEPEQGPSGAALSPAW